MRRMRCWSPAPRCRVQRRLGKTEHLERVRRPRPRPAGVRGHARGRGRPRPPWTPPASPPLAERAVAMARVVPEDPFGGLAEEAAPADADRSISTTPTEPVRRSADRARRDGRGGGAGGARRHQLRRRRGRLSAAPRSCWSPRPGSPAASCAPATRSPPPRSPAPAPAMQRDYDYTSAVHLRRSRRRRAASAARAGEKAVARLNPQRPKTAKLPVVYDPRVAGGLLGHLAGAINGAAVARGTTLPQGQARRSGSSRRASTIIDDPRRRRGLRSRAVRRRGRADRRARAGRRRRADDVAARQPQRAAARPAHHRPCGARHRRPAVAGVRPTCISRAGTADARRS